MQLANYARCAMAKEGDSIEFLSLKLILLVG